jgi:hypothetical protein
VPTATRSPTARPVTAGKEGLFDAVVADRRERGRDAVPFDADDLPGFAVAMYDEHVRRPDPARLMGWMRLERRPSGLLFDDTDLGPKLEAVARAQAAGRLRAGDPADLLALVVGMASAWSPASVSTRPPRTSPRPAMSAAAPPSARG